MITADINANILKYILSSYNAIDEVNAGNPQNVLNNLSSIVTSPLSEADIFPQINQATFSQSNETTQSYEESQYCFAAEAGLSGKYAFFSASVNVSDSNSSWRSGSYFSYRFNERIDLGSVSFKDRKDPVIIRSYIDAHVLNKLDGISSLKDAADFVSSHGTHIVTGVGLGGSVMISIVSDSVSARDSQDLSIKFKAAYNGVASFEASAQATQDLTSSYSQYSLLTKLSSIGPNASNLDLSDPSTFGKFGTDCSIDTVYGVTSSIEFSDIAPLPAKDFLGRYISLIIACRSINFPSVFSRSTSLRPYITNTVTAYPPFGYKTIGGGATVTKGCDSFITTCGPSIDSNNSIQGWNASCTDKYNAANDTLSLTSYCIAVYDEDNVMNIGLSPVAIGTNSGTGYDSATATLAPGLILTGGGVIVDISNEGDVKTKFLYRTRPSGSPTEGFNRWDGAIRDFQAAATNVQLKVYAIGISLSSGNELSISNSIVSEVEVGQHPNASASVSVRIAGGGVDVHIDDGEFGSLIQQNYPSDSNHWTEYNKDEMYVSSSTATVYAMQLKGVLNL